MELHRDNCLRLSVSGKRERELHSTCWYGYPTWLPLPQFTDMKKIIKILAVVGGAISAPSVIAQAEAPQGYARAVVAACIIAESGGHGKRGMEAVYEVIHTRASQRRTTCVIEVLRPKQFSCFNGRNAADVVRQMSQHRHYKWVHDELLKFIPLTAHTGKNPTNRCTHYHAVSVSPRWARGSNPVAIFGGHKWYRGIK